MTQRSKVEIVRSSPTVPRDAYPPRFRSDAAESYKVHHGPAPRRLADVPRLSFKEGLELGGQVLWEESAAEVRAKQKGPMHASFGFGGLIALLGAIAGLFGSSAPWYLLVLAGAAWAAAGPSISRTMERRGWFRVTPVRVCAHGLSLGGPDGPYMPFDGLYAVEHARSAKGAVDFTHLTFIDGSELSITFGYFRTPGVVVRKEYKRVKGILQDKFPRWASQRLEWARDAEKFVAGLRYVKGPVRLQMEALAIEQGRDVVDLQFIREYWRTIGAHHGLGVNTFLGQAFEAFGVPASRK